MSAIYVTVEKAPRHLAHMSLTNNTQTIVEALRSKLTDGDVPDGNGRHRADD